MRYAVFSGQQYYPQRGWYDLQGRYETELEAVASAKAWTAGAGSLSWAQAVDLETGRILWEGDTD